MTRLSRFSLLPALVLVALAVGLTGCADGNFGELVTGRAGLGCFGLILLILDVLAFLSIAGSRVSLVSKLLWGALVFFFPFGGLLIWYLFGPKK